jgi:hypothetical protein
MSFPLMILPAMTKAALALLSLLVVLLSFNEVAFSQLGEGNFTMEYTTESVEYSDESRTQVVSRSKTIYSIDMGVTFLNLRNTKEFQWLIKSPHQQEDFAETLLQASNHTERPADGVTWRADLPVGPITIGSHSEQYETDPCSDNGALMLKSTYDFHGPVSDGTIIDVVLAVAGDRSAVRVHSQSRGGEINSRQYPYKRHFVEIDYSSGDCGHKSTDDITDYSVNINPPRTSSRINSREESIVNRDEPAEIPIAQFIEYLEDPRIPRTFIAPFSSYYDDGRTVTETKGTITLKLGKVATSHIVLSIDGDYEKWLPTLKPNHDPSTLKVKASLSDQKAEPTKIRLTLGDVSSYPGIATNFPVDGKSSLDMYFPKEQPTGIEWIDSVTVRTTEKVRETFASVAVRDYAAQAKLYAVGIDKSYPGKEQYGDLPFLQLPKDRDVNLIADSWEALHDAQGRSATWDNDAFPTGQKRQGDGYTFFEEYRGFVVERNAEYDATGSVISGKHIRTNPDHKDLFVFDPDGLVKQYYEPHTPARLNLHYITPETMRFNGEAMNPRNRVVNTNTPRAQRYADQFGLYIVRWTAILDNSSVTLGEASDITQVDAKQAAFRQEMGLDANPRNFRDGDAFLLKNSYVVKVAATYVEKSYGPKSALRALTKTIIHEVGHAIGIHHHQDANGGESEESTCSGVSECAMRYEALDEKNHRVPRNQFRYCGEETYKINDQETQSFVDVPAHNCYGMIDVKSDP